MSSGIFAVANIGQYKLYVGETHHLKTRWPKMLLQFSQGSFPNAKLQQAWQESGGSRRFTFYTAQQIREDDQILGLRQFLRDVGNQ
jgi:hypothetical protein